MVNSSLPPSPSRRTVVAAGLGSLALGACSAPEGKRPGSPSGAAPDSATHPEPSTPTQTAAGSATRSPQTSGGTRPAVAGTAGPDITHGPRTTQQVALTFHGQGPTELAHRVLETCRAADAHITVFAVGTWLAGAPSVGRQIVAAGHELGNHTWSHQQMKQLTREQAVREAVRGAQALRTAVGSAGWWFRPSGTRQSTPTIREAAAVAGYARCVSYDVDPQDFLDPGATAVRDRTLAAVRPGSVVSLHLGHEGTVTALPEILAGLHRQGLRPVTLSTLLANA